jgi:hypothetical protein
MGDNIELNARTIIEGKERIETVGLAELSRFAKYQLEN